MIVTYQFQETRLSQIGFKSLHKKTYNGLKFFIFLIAQKTIYSYHNEVMAENPFVSIDQATSALCNGELVAIPTETVYGLAARIDKESAVSQIFTLKERPFYDPLIVHISQISMLKDLVLNFSNESHPLLLKLAKNFWPGPLTLVFPKNPKYVSDLITSSQDTVAVRSPNHPLAQQIITQLNVPLAAPSANPFKRTSPTSAGMVKEYFPDLKVVDGGPCNVGIESTIVAQDEQGLKILRPGMITLEQIQNTVGPDVSVRSAIDESGPGSMQEHYQPEKPLFLIQGQSLTSHKAKEQVMRNLEISFLQERGLNERLHVLRIHEVVLDAQPLLCARYIYRQLIEEGKNADLLFINWDLKKNKSQAWQSILNRLQKAAIKTVHV